MLQLGALLRCCAPSLYLETRYCLLACLNDCITVSQHKLLVCNLQGRPLGLQNLGQSYLSLDTDGRVVRLDSFAKVNVGAWHEAHWVMQGYELGTALG